MPANPEQDVLLRISAALLPTLLLSLDAALTLAAVVPASPDARAAIGIYVPLPLYVLFACLAARAQSGRRAWLSCLAGIVVLEVVLLIRSF